MTADICEVVITAPNAEWLADSTRRLVDDHLVACGHNIAAIRSIYRWQGTVYDEGEARVALHTRTQSPGSWNGPSVTTRTRWPASSPCQSSRATPSTSSGSWTRPPSRCGKPVSDPKPDVRRRSAG